MSNMRLQKKFDAALSLLQCKERKVSGKVYREVRSFTLDTATRSPQPFSTTQKMGKKKRVGKERLKKKKAVLEHDG